MILIIQLRFKFIDASNSVTAADVNNNPEKYIFRCDFNELKYLFDVNPPEGSVYIRSITEPVDEEMELDQKKVNNWLMHFGLFPYEQLHCSGHASGYDIKEMIHKISPKQVMPVHTENPKEFGSIHANVILKNLGEKYSLS
jgi:ribonuclease J